MILVPFLLWLICGGTSITWANVVVEFDNVPDSLNVTRFCMEFFHAFPLTPLTPDYCNDTTNWVTLPITPELMVFAVEGVFFKQVNLVGEKLIVEPEAFNQLLRNSSIFTRTESQVTVISDVTTYQIEVIAFTVTNFITLFLACLWFLCVTRNRTPTPRSCSNSSSSSHHHTIIPDKNDI